MSLTVLDIVTLHVHLTHQIRQPATLDLGASKGIKVQAQFQI